VVSRYGGEEFAILLPRTDIEEIGNLGERIRRSLASEPVAVGEQWLAVTASIGAATLQPGQGLDELMADADRALYQAKQAGRNRRVGPAPIPVAVPQG